MAAVKTVIALKPVIVRPEIGSCKRYSNYMTVFIK
jgi:hypothetical protein